MELQGDKPTLHITKVPCVPFLLVLPQTSPLSFCTLRDFLWIVKDTQTANRIRYFFSIFVRTVVPN